MSPGLLAVFFANAASGIIGLAGDSGAQVTLPAAFPSAVDAAAAARNLTLSDLVKVDYINAVSIGGPNESRHIHVVKSESPFRITLNNESNQTTGYLEIWVTYLHSLTR